MITTILQGGMGNQMFQYAMGLAQARRLGTKLCLDATRLGGKRPFNLGQWSLESLILTTREEPTVVERGMPYNQEVVDSIKDGDILQGYWQSEKYFENVKTELRSIFTPFAPIDADDLETISVMEHPNSVAVHVRRGDYLIEPHKSFHGVLSDKYYAEAIMKIWYNFEFTAPFFVFSDDTEYVKQKFGKAAYFISPGREARDIYLMSRCKHAIIANSSFSWWGAWLGDTKERMVVAPEKWFDQAKEDYSDIVPSRWVKV